MAERASIPYAVQDLTNPSLALLQSVGLAARTHTILGVEANSRQFFPAANAVEAQVHPLVYNVRKGVTRADSLCGPGLGMQVDHMPGFEQSVSQRDIDA